MALVSAVAVLLAMVAIYAPPAQAHEGIVSWDCDGWSIDLNTYYGGTVNIVVDGVVVVDTAGFFDVYSESGTWDNTQTHTLDIVVWADDDPTQSVHALGSNGSFSPDFGNGEWSFTLNITQDACNPPPPQTVTTAVAAGSCEVGQGSQAAGSVDVTITPASGATVTVYSDAGLTNPVGSLTATGSIDGLAPGTYYWAAQAATNYQLTGPSSGQVTIADCDVTVSVAAGVCTVDTSGAAVGVVDVVIDPVSGATVTVYSDAAMTQEVFNTDATGSFDLAPGTYYWSADAAGGFDIDGVSSGQFTIDPCDVAVDVAGVCVLNGNVGSGVISVTISVDGGATVVVSDGNGPVATLTESGTVTVPEGASYSWTANSTDGFTISGDDSGTVDIEECTPDDQVGASILVTVEGTCEVTDGVGRGEIDVTISVADGATVTVTDESGVVVGTFTSDGVLTVPEGASYSWVAVPSDGFEFPVGFESSGTIDIGGCTQDEVLASIQVTVSGTCELDGDEGEGFVDVSISVPDGATVVVRDSDGDVVGTLTDDATLSVPEGATYTWEATASEGFEFPPGFASSGTITIERCSDPETLPFTGFDPYQMGVFAILLMGAGVTAMYLAPREEGA